MVCGMDSLTTKQHIDAALTSLDAHRAGCAPGDPAGREFSLAITHLEDAKMRLTRGLAKRTGVFNEVDLEHPDGIARAQANFLVNATEERPPHGRSPKPEDVPELDVLHSGDIGPGEPSAAA